MPAIPKGSFRKKWKKKTIRKVAKPGSPGDKPLKWRWLEFSLVSVSNGFVMLDYCAQTSCWWSWNWSRSWKWVESKYLGHCWCPWQTWLSWTHWLANSWGLWNTLRQSCWLVCSLTNHSSRRWNSSLIGLFGLYGTAHLSLMWSK